jgi:hypothetical protein
MKSECVLFCLGGLREGLSEDWATGQRSEGGEPASVQASGEVLEGEGTSEASPEGKGPGVIKSRK